MNENKTYSLDMWQPLTDVPHWSELQKRLDALPSMYRQARFALMKEIKRQKSK